jgi:hypothetical protein
MSIEALSMVLNHSQAKGAAKIVLLGIANHLGPDAHEGAWPSQDRLASYANITDRAVRKAVKTLVDLGELRVEVADGVSRNQYKPNRYWIQVSCPPDCDGSMWHRRVELSNTQGGTFEQSGRNLLTDRVEPEFLLNSKEPSEKTKYKQDRFEEFWQHYPRKEAKGRALKAWEKAVKTTNRQLIIDAAEIYGKSYTGEYKFIPLPATWLNDMKWLDEPPPAARQGGPVTILNMYADEPCEHGDPMGESRCALCRRK